MPQNGKKDFNPFLAEEYVIKLFLVYYIMPSTLRAFKKLLLSILFLYKETEVNGSGLIT